MSQRSFLAALCLSVIPAAIASQSKCDMNNNNLMRCFISSSQLATSYCSSFLAIPHTTTTVTATSTSYLTVPTLVSIETDLKFSSEFLTSYTPVVITETVTTFTTTLITEAPAPPVKHRRVPEPKAPKPSPTSLACLTDVKSSQASSSISFACGCLSIKPQTVSTTTTLQVTNTAYSSFVQTTTTTTVVEVVTILPSTTTATQYAIETDTSSCFGLTIASSSADQSLVGQVLELTASDYDTTVGQLSHFSDPMVAGTFYFSSTNALVAGLNGAYPGNTAGIVPGVSAFYVQFANAAGKAQYGFVDLVCSVTQAGILSCVDGSGRGDDVLQFCADQENHMIIANSLYDTTCAAVTLQTVPKSCAGVF